MLCRGALLIVMLVMFASCGRGDENSGTQENSGVNNQAEGGPAPVEPASSPPALLDEAGGAALELILPAQQGPSLTLASQDLSDVYAALTGEELLVSGAGLDGASRQVVILGELDPGRAELGEQGYSLERVAWDDGRSGVRVTAATEVAMMYGLYDLIARMGARFHHPEESHLPAEDLQARLPWDLDGAPELPAFELRGFHEHTQHPIPMSDYYMRPEPEFRPYVSRYLKWMARNRQNVASWHMLKTVDVDKWEPYITDIVDEAHGYGIDIGVVVSFVDEQQNNFKIIPGDRVDASGEPLPEEQQIHEVMSRFHGFGFDFFTFQIGSSEFTKPTDEITVERLNTAAAYARTLDPQPDLFAWIHMICSVETDDGGYFFHLPGEADPDIGTWVHTVMFHTLEHPSPVYDCENFHHQRDFLIEELDEREQVYFPETAWWLGFDNNMPLALPLTGWTREWDIREELSPYPGVRGHVTFTTGREWNYWQYDHYLTRSTWDNTETWESYQEWIEPMYGDGGEAVADVIGRWTEQQRQDILVENPLIYFYLSGELLQDEIGAKAGILARRPKLSYQEVVEYSDAEFDAWKARDYDMLARMRDTYAQILVDLPRPGEPVEGAGLEARLDYEVWAGLYIFVKRIEHALELYAGVSKAREWVKLYEAGAAFDDTRRVEIEAEAKVHLDAARAITAEVHELILSVESTTYRYPLEILTEPKEETLTSYPFGYLEQTSTAHFWTRRDDQLDRLIADRFSEDLDEWEREPALLFFAKGRKISLSKPDDRVAGTVLASFIPQMLVGLDGDLGAGSESGVMVLGQDDNENFEPDPMTEESFALTDLTESGAVARGDVYRFIVRNDAGDELGDGLDLRSPTFTLRFTRTPAGIVVLEEMDLAGEVASSQLLGMIQEVGGIDTEGASGLLKSVFGVPAEEELPELLEIAFLLELEQAVR